MSKEIKVGITFLSGLFLLALATFVIEDINPFREKGQTYSVYFSEVAGLGAGDPVHFSGLEVGKVTDVEIDREYNRVKVTYTVNENHADYVKIQADSRHRIGTDLFGRAYLAVSFGKEGGREVKEGMITIPGEKPTDLGQIMDDAGGIMREAEGLPTEVKKLTISLNENQENVLNEILDILQENRPHLKIFLEKIADVAASISNAEGTIGKLVKEDAVYTKADKVMSRINSLGARFDTTGKLINEILGENKQNIRKVTDNLADASPDFARSMETISEMLEENRETLKRIITGVSEATPKVNKSLFDINIMTDKMAKGEGLFGAAIMDDEFKKNIDKAISDISDAAEEITVFAKGANRLSTFLGIDVRSNALDRETQALLYLRITPSSHKEYFLGGTFYINHEEPDPAEYPDLDWREGTFDGMTFNLLLGWRFFNDRLTLKVGALESVVGGIAEYSICYNTGGVRKPYRAFPQITSFSIEARALDKDYEKGDYEEWENEVMLRALIKHRFGNGLTLQIGGDNLLNIPRFMVGFSFEFLDEDIKYVAGTVG